VKELLAVGAGGFVGAIARYGLSGLVYRWFGESFPVGTLAVNLLGCLVIGLLSALSEDRQALSAHARLFVMIGLLGSFTTFSTFGYETVELLRSGSVKLALLNAVGSVVLGLAAVILGRTLFRLLMT